MHLNRIQASAFMQEAGHNENVLASLVVDDVACHGCFAARCMAISAKNVDNGFIPVEYIGTVKSERKV